MITIRSSQQRGYADHGWLKSYHTFSFASYYDPQHMGFGPLRVINEDKVLGPYGFGTHSHNNMEIITILLDGVLEHKDTLGNSAQIHPDEVQVMSAGTGIQHSEYNPVAKTQNHLLQIWIEPNQEGVEPRYQQKQFPRLDKTGMTLVVSPDSRQDSVWIHQDALLYKGFVKQGEDVSYTFNSERLGWLQVLSGQIRLNGQLVEPGDGVAIKNESTIQIIGEQTSQFLLFDLPANF